MAGSGTYGLNLYQPPAGEPIGFEEAKNYCKVDADITQDDELIASLIRAARRTCEKYTERQFVSATWRHTLDYFPGYLAGSPSTYTAWREWPAFGDIIRLPKPPLQSVLSLTYVDTTGTLQLLNPALYQVDADSEPARIRPAYGQVWPVARAQLSTVNTIYVAGYGPVTTIAAGVPAATGSPGTTVAAAVQVIGSQTVTPASMLGIAVGAALNVDTGSSFEQVVVTAVTATTFTAYFLLTHLAGFAVTPVSLAVQQTVTPASMLGIYVGTVLAIDTGQAREEVTVTAVSATTFTAAFALEHKGPTYVGPGLPDTLRRAMLIAIAYWYRNRESGPKVEDGLPMVARILLDSEWYGEYA